VTRDEADQPVFVVREQFYRGVLRGEAKTTAGARAVPLAPSMAKRLAERRLASRWSGDDDPVFTTARGTFVDAHNFRRRWRAATKRADLEWATPHTRRHSLASLLLSNGHTIEQIAAWLGHTDSSFTLRTYVHARDVGSAEFLDGVLGAAGR
jgi:integrase